MKTEITPKRRTQKQRELAILTELRELAQDIGGTQGAMLNIMSEAIYKIFTAFKAKQNRERVQEDFQKTCDRQREIIQHLEGRIEYLREEFDKRTIEHELKMITCTRFLNESSDALTDLRAQVSELQRINQMRNGSEDAAT